MKNIAKSDFSSLLVALLLPMAFAACSEEWADTPAPVQNGDWVEVNVQVRAEELTPLSAAAAPTRTAQSEPADDIVCEMGSTASSSTRATGIDDPATTSDTKIMNLWVVQYDGTGDGAKLVTSTYIADYTVAANRTAKLIANSADQTIVFLANTFDRTLSWPVNSTLSELKGYKFTTQTLGTILSKDPNTATTGTETFPNDGDYYQRLNGMYTTPIAEGGTLSHTLQHNACRISVNVTNNTAGTTYPVTLTSADVENVPGCIYFLTDYTGYTSGNNVGKPSSSLLEHYGKYNYPNVITWASGEGTSTATKSAKLYLPANESGIITSNTSPKLKSLFAPSRATILRIRGTYRDGANDIPITYSFALGEDMVSNYQLVPNGDYVYNITLNARGDKTTDGRVSYGSAGGVDYTDLVTWPLSNCYICNPPTTGDATFKIPVARVDQFWGGGNYENVPNNCLGSTNAWTVSVIWSDMPVNASNFVVTKNTGTGKDDYFEVKVPNTCVKGNVVIGIKNTLSSNWLWSWHLWVTDYCPDEAKYLNQQGAFIDGTDTYHLTGGDVQRYQKATGTAVQKVYMDRCIGAMSSTATGYARGTLYYQFGRKDPFPGNSGEYYDAGSPTPSTYTLVTKAYNETDAAEQPRNVPYSVKNPTTFIKSGVSYWTYDDIYNPTSGLNSIVWQDPSASSNANKSIFDPSPSGWKVPVSHTGLSYNTFSSGICTANTQVVSGGGTVKLPAHGCRGYSGGGLSDGGSRGYSWSSSPSGVANAYGLVFFSGYLNAHDDYYYYNPQRATGKPVRPVQE